MLILADNQLYGLQFYENVILGWYLTENVMKA